MSTFFILLLFFISFVVGIALSLHCTPVILLFYSFTLLRCCTFVCRAFLKISYRAEENFYPAKIKVYLSIYLSVVKWAQVIVIVVMGCYSNRQISSTHRP